MPLNDDQTKRIAELFPCFAAAPNDAWNTSELVAVTPATPHSIREGHVLQHAAFILSGRIRIHRITPEGREVTLYRVHGGECCVLMLASILGETAYEASVDIETDAEVLLVPIPTFSTLMDTIKPIKQYVYKQIMERLTDVTTLLEHIAFRSIPYRIAEYLLSAGGTLRMTHEQLAIELGTAREVVSRTLRNFVQEGAISLGRRRIQIVDANRLERIMARRA
ncbi:MAG: Crp/Fnr family transcriptional regulator [Cohnella sp.]|nr:Crp/Fnr family transcriptional regulator [Cohnella sp.]